MINKFKIGDKVVATSNTHRHFRGVDKVVIGGEYTVDGVEEYNFGDGAEPVVLIHQIYGGWTPACLFELAKPVSKESPKAGGWVRLLTNYCGAMKGDYAKIEGIIGTNNLIRAKFNGETLGLGIYLGGECEWVGMNLPSPFKTGDYVEYFRHPNDEEWGNMGKVANLRLGDRHRIKEFSGSLAKIENNVFWYPQTCFRLVVEGSLTTSTEIEKMLKLTSSLRGEYGVNTVYSSTPVTVMKIDENKWEANSLDIYKQAPIIIKQQRKSKIIVI